MLALSFQLYVQLNLCNISAVWIYYIQNNLKKT